MSVVDAAAAFATGATPATAIPVADVEIDLEDGDDDKMLDINSAIAVEKEIAADTIGVLFSATKNHFLPYVEKSTLVLIGLLSHYYEGIRKAACDALLEIVRTFFDISQGSPEGSAAQHTKDLVKHIMPQLIEMFESEDNK